METMLGLLTLAVASSIVLPAVDPAFNDFTDGLWYSFVVITTIGFGDIVATTIFGKIITIFLGLYGLIVVAVITSIIVNFYSETTRQNDDKKEETTEEIEKEEEEKKSED